MGSFFARLHQRHAPRKAAIERKHDAERREKRVVRRPEGKALFAPQRSVKTSNVVVVGAGFAGLAAANALSKACNVTILEARDRIGGRVWTQVDSVTHRAIEAGAELIGYNHPTWIMLAKKFDLGMTVLTSEAAFTSLKLDMPLYLKGKLVPKGHVERLYDDMEAIFAKLCAKATKIDDPNRPWEATGAGRLDAMSVADWLAGQRCAPLLRRAIEVEFENTNVTPTTEQSLLGLLAAIRGGGIGGDPDDYFNRSETLKCEQGNQELANRLLGEILEIGGDELRLSSPVEAIEIRRDHVSVVSATGRLDADHVVLAVPPSVWHKIRITPEIAPAFRMSMGPAIKYLSPVRTRFWFGDDLSPSAVSEAIGVTWDGTDNQLQLDGQAVELSLFAGGGAAAAAVELFRQGKQQLDAFYARELDNIFPEYSSQLAGEPQFINWPQDPWTMGGYVCPAPGEVTTISPFLSEPFHDRLHFAGDHCCPAFFGYMEGALQSGSMAATTIRRAEGLD